MSEQKTAKIEKIVKVKPVESERYGTTFYITIKLDNGEVGTIGKKKEDALKVGQSFTYTSEPDNYGGLKFKEPAGNRGFGGGGVSINTKRETALKCAVELFALRQPDGAKDKKVKEVVSGIESIADLFLKWLEK